LIQLASQASRLCYEFLKPSLLGTNMQQREKILGSVFAGVMGAFFIVPSIWAWFNEPVDDLQAALEIETSKTQKKDDEFGQARLKQLRVKDWKGRSLSPKPQEAALQYQQWLTDLAEDGGEFSNVQVAPEAPATAANQPFVAVRFRLKAEATLAQVRLFLFRFSQADLLHGITLMNLDSPATTGNPKLTVTMQFEALSLRDAPPRGPSLFARTELSEEWKLKASTADAAANPWPVLRVKSTEGFPDKAPFMVRIARHYFEVTEANNTAWTLKPDVNSTDVKTAAIELIEGETVELVKVHPDFAKRTLKDFDPILRQNPFLKPIPYAPKMEFVGAKSVSKGGSLELVCKANGFDLGAGEPVFTLNGEPPKGLTLDARTGKLTWKPNDEQPLGDVSLQVTATAPGLKAPLTEALKLSFKQTNKAPKFGTIGDRHAVLGKEFVLPIQATDEDTEGKLTYSLSPGAPEGSKIDAATGEFRWTPPATMIPGSVKVTVQVADAGTPPATTTQEITLTVGDDVAQFTVLTGIIVREGKKEFWLSDKSTNKRLVLHEGENVKYADLDATVERIEPKFVLLKKEEAIWRLNLGDNLKSLQKVDMTKKPEAN
jgi:hypothetical protein